MSGSLTPPPQLATIPFDQIPAQIQTPGAYTEVQPVYGNLGVLAWPTKVLIIGQALAGAPGVLGSRVQVTRLSDATARWGAGSMVEGMVAQFIAANPYVPLDVIAVADAAGATKASGTWTIGGTWTNGGTLPLYVGGVQIAIGVLPTDTPTIVATNAATAINTVLAGARAFPAVATSALGVVTMTARNGGLEANNLKLEVAAESGDVLPAGMTATVAPMAGGATNPAIGPVISAISGLWYTDIVMPWQDTANVQALAEELANRYNAMEHLDAQAYTTWTGTFGQQQALQVSANCQFLVALPITNPVSPPWEMSASLAGVASFALTNDPSRQLRGIALPGIVGQRAVDRMNSTEVELALEGGLSPVSVQPDGSVVLTRVVTTYLTNAEGVADPAWHNIMVPKTMSRIRYDWNTYSQLTYPSNKLADDGSIAAEYDGTVATPSRVRASWASRYRLYEKLGWLENGDVQIQAAVFVRNASDPNRLDSTRPMTIIGNLMIDASILQFEA